MAIFPVVAVSAPALVMVRSAIGVVGMPLIAMDEPEMVVPLAVFKLFVNNETA